jgi:hypothetical protein
VKRVWVFALSASGVAAAVVFVSALVERPERREGALTADGAPLQTPSPSVDALDRSAPSGGAREAARLEAAAEPAPAHDVVDTESQVEPAPVDPHRVNGKIQLATRVLDEEGFADYTYSPLPLSGRGRVRLLPMGPLNGRALLELPLPVDAPFAGWPALRGEYNVDVFEPGYAPSVAELFEDEDGLAVECYTTPGPTIELDVRLPDGSQPSHALLTFVPRDWSDSWLPGPRRGLRALRDVFQTARSDHREFFLWTPGDPRIGLEVESNGTVTDLIVVTEPYGDSPYDALAPTRYHSDFVVRYDSSAASPIRVQLHEAAHVSIEVERPAAVALEVEPWVLALRLGRAPDGAESPLIGFDAAELLADPNTSWPKELFDHPGFDSIWRSTWIRRGTPFEERFVLSGRWRFAAGWGDEPASTFQEVDIAPGLNRVSLTLGQPGTEGFVPVRFVAEGGSTPRDVEHLDYDPITAEPAGIVNSTVKWTRGTNGERWLSRTVLEEVLAEAQGVRPLYLAGRDRDSEHPRLGFLSGPLYAEMPELVLTEVLASQAVIRVQHAGNSPFVLSVRAEFLEPLTDDVRLLNIAARQRVVFESGRLSFDPRRPSVPMPAKLPPGRYRFSFDVLSAPVVKPLSVELVLAPGRPEVPVEIPTLYQLTVHAPSLGAGVGLRLRPQDEAPSATGVRAARDLVALDSEQRAVFSSLPAGPYVLTHGASHAPQNIVVPCGEVLYEPRRADAFEVRLAPLDGGGQGALARAGFRTGDVLLEFNGRGLCEHDDLEALLEVIAENAVTVRVRRGAHTLELRLGPMPDPGDPWATFDADFVPAWR